MQSVSQAFKSFAIKAFIRQGKQNIKQTVVIHLNINLINL